MPNIYGVEEAFPKTKAGVIEIKTLPEATMLVTSEDGGYFSHSDRLFSRLFRYIKTNEIAMTTPVEAKIEDAQMRFYVGQKGHVKNLQNQEGVRVVTVPERAVASIGVRGAYTEKNFLTAKATLEAWLNKQTQYIPTSSAYAVFWDAPFVPWFLKRFEVHVPVQIAGEGDA